jgi:hypothetical protein
MAEVLGQALYSLEAAGNALAAFGIGVESMHGDEGLQLVEEV